MLFSMTSHAYDANRSIDRRFKQFSDAGFKWIHWAEHDTVDRIYTKADAEQIARSADKYGMVIQNIHGVWTLDGDRPFTEDHWYEINRNRIQFISCLGGDCIVLHVPVLAPETDFRAERKESERLLRLLLPVARKFNIRLVVENLETHPCRPLFDHLFQSFAPEDLGFCYDSGHANMTGELDILDRYLERLAVTHLHDNHGKEDEHLHPGHGTIDWKPIISCLKKKSDLNCINLEVFWPGGIPKDKWCRMAYQSILNLWESEAK
jgi:sugar phosphate isomerase/epimerase